MNYHNITYPDQNNGSGLRVVLWLSGCEHHCYKCQNPQTWDENNGIFFDKLAKNELFEELSKNYIKGLTLTGGDPLYVRNLDEVLNIIIDFRTIFGNKKDIWLYTGYTWEDIFYNNKNLKRRQIVTKCDVLVDGKYIDNLRDITLEFRGSNNQRLIDIQRSIKNNTVITYEL